MNAVTRIITTATCNVLVFHESVFCVERNLLMLMQYATEIFVVRLHITFLYFTATNGCVVYDQLTPDTISSL